MYSSVSFLYLHCISFHLKLKDLVLHGGSSSLMLVLIVMMQRVFAIFLGLHLLCSTSSIIASRHPHSAKPLPSSFSATLDPTAPSTSSLGGSFLGNSMLSWVRHKLPPSWALNTLIPDLHSKSRTWLLGLWVYLIQPFRLCHPTWSILFTSHNIYIYIYLIISYSF